MSHFQPRSFFLGVATGIVILVVVAGGMQLKNLRSPATNTQAAGATGGSGRQRGQGGQGLNLSLIASRLGMTQTDLENELKTGKSLRDIAKEHGVDFTALRPNTESVARLRQGSGSFLSGSGVTFRSGSGARLRTGNGTRQFNGTATTSSRSTTQP